MYVYLIVIGVAVLYNMVYGIHCIRSKRYLGLSGTIVMILFIAAALFALSDAL